MIRSASEGISKLKSYRASLESNVNAAGKAVKAAVDRCDLATAQSAMGELNRIVDSAQAQCPQLPDSISQVTQESFDLVEKLKNYSANLVSNLKAAVGVVQAEVSNCNLRGAELAMGEVNRIADSIRCAQIPAEVPGLVRLGSDSFEGLKRGGGNIRAQIESARNQGLAALNACNPDQAISEFNRALSLYQENQACAGSFDAANTKADLKRTERLKDLYRNLTLEVSQAEGMVASCSGGFTPGYFDTALAKLNRAAGIVGELNGYAGCAPGAEESRINTARQTINRLLTAREGINGKLVRARALLNTTPAGDDPRAAAQHAKANVEKIANLLNEARELAIPADCFRDQLKSLEGLVSEITRKGDALGSTAGDGQPTDEVPGALGPDKGKNKAPTEQVPTALGGPTRPLGAPLPPRRQPGGTKPGETTPTDEVPGALGSNTGRPPVRDDSNKQPGGSGGTTQPAGSKRSCDPAILNLILGTWQSEWGPVTLSGSCDRITGYWVQSPSARGEITGGSFDSDSRTLTFFYKQSWNNVTDGRAVFSRVTIPMIAAAG